MDSLIPFSHPLFCCFLDISGHQTLGSRCVAPHQKTALLLPLRKSTDVSAAKSSATLVSMPQNDFCPCYIIIHYIMGLLSLIHTLASRILML